MYRVHVSLHALADIKLVSNGDRRSWKDKQAFLDLSGKALADIKADPESGERHIIVDREFFAFHLRRRKHPAYHYFLYRIVGHLVEVGRLLHESMKPEEGNIPREWFNNGA